MPSIEYSYPCFEDRCFPGKNQYCNERIEIRHCEVCTESMCGADDAPIFCKEYYCKSVSPTTMPSNKLDEYVSHSLRRIEFFHIVTLILVVVIVFCGFLCLGRWFRKSKIAGKIMTFFHQMKRKLRKQGVDYTSDNEPLTQKDEERAMKDVCVNTDNSWQEDIVNNKMSELETKFENKLEMELHKIRQAIPNGNCVEEYKCSETVQGQNGTSKLYVNDANVLTESQKEQLRHVSSVLADSSGYKKESSTQRKPPQGLENFHEQGNSNSTSGFDSMPTATGFTTTLKIV